MIISYKYKYIFVGIPFSASSAISKELIENYAGEPILHKHANLPFLKKKYTQLDLKKYVKFAVIRDPIQIMNTIYNKYITNPYNVFTDPHYYVENGGHITKKSRKIYYKIHKEGWSFDTFLSKTFNYPYDSVYSLNKRYLDFTLNFDNIQNDFDSLLKFLLIEKKRNLPSYNRTNKIANVCNVSDDKLSEIFGPFYIENNKFFNKEVYPTKANLILYNAMKPIRKLKWNWLDARLITADKNDSYFKQFSKPLN